MEELFSRILEMSLAATWLALAVMVLRLALKKAPRWIFCLLWGLVALRLVCPFSVESDLSLQPRMESLPTYTEQEVLPPLTGGTTGGNPAVWGGAVSGGDSGVNTARPAEEPARGLSLMSVFSWAWLGGAVLMLGYALGSFLALKRRVATATILRGNIRQSDRISSPFVLGLFCPKIYLPYDMDADALPHVIAHEQAHIRRKDHWVKPLGFLLLAVHWFNPLMWAAYILLCRDIELACDERVIAGLDRQERQAYSMALLRCSVRRVRVAACPLAFGEVGVKRRVKNVMNYKKPAFWLLVVAVLAVAVAAVCFLTDPKEQPEDTPGTETTDNQSVATKPSFGYLSDNLWTFDGIRTYVDDGTGAAYGTFTGGEFLAQSIALSYLPEDGSYFNRIILAPALDGKDLTVINTDGEKIYSGSPGLCLVSDTPANEAGYLRYTREEFLTYLEDKMLYAYPGTEGMVTGEKLESLVPEVTNVDIEYYYKTEDNRTEIACTIYYFDGVPTWFAEGDALRIYKIYPYYSLDDAVSAAILEQAQPEEPDGLFHCESHVILTTEELVACGLEESPDCYYEVTAYTMVQESRFRFADGRFTEVGGSNYAAAITFTVEEDGSYTLKEYWTPRDGAGLEPDLRERFPDEVEDDALDTQKYVYGLIQSCYAQAIAYGNIDTTPIIVELLETITDETYFGSMATGYIESHKLEYRELKYYGEYTLRYCFGQFLQGGQDDLRGEIMASVCEDIMAIWGEALLIESVSELNGQEWFDTFYANAAALRRQFGEEEMRQTYPASWLVLEMAG